MGYSLDTMHHYPKFATVEKQVGETPLVATERLRESLGIPAGVPMAYAGRLDPMASGKLLVLIGDECKRQSTYHGFDKSYRVEVLLGAHSDTGDVLGVAAHSGVPHITDTDAHRAVNALAGTLSLPYPHFSSKTVKGKPLHVWTLEKRLHEIEIPTYTATIYRAHLSELCHKTKHEILETVLAKIETIPQVTDPRKVLGADFRRKEVREAWSNFEKVGDETYPVLTIDIIASSGVYMRTLAEIIGEKLKTRGLAYSIHRTNIGKFCIIYKNIGFWLHTF